MNAVITKTLGHRKNLISSYLECSIARYSAICRVIQLLCLSLFLISWSFAQNSAPESDDTGSANSSEPSVTFKTGAHMVTIEVVAKDSKGNHARGLTAADFQVFERAPSRDRKKHVQKIVAFHEVKVSDLVDQAKSEMQPTSDVYTNQVTLQTNPVPPTIVLVDGLNTAPENQAQVHVQMIKMLRALPKDVPVAVFLLGHNLRLIQGLTTDPNVLQATLEKLPVITASSGEASIDPRDDPNSVSAQLESVSASGGFAQASSQALEAARQFEQFIYATQMDRRVQDTIDALSALGHHLGGYPGRKNLLWISTAFPIYLSPLDYGHDDEGLRNYWPQLRRLNGVLSEAKVAVYPINPAGVETESFYSAEVHPHSLSPERISSTLSRQTISIANQQDTMRVIANGTGGQVCTGNNDLGDCIHRAVDDSSEFYEIAYYPDFHKWNGEYRIITVSAKQPGLHLAYRQGYYSVPEGGGSTTEQKAELQSACRDYLDATSIPVEAKIVPSDSPDKVTFKLTLKLSDLTLIPARDGGRDLNLSLAACTFDKQGSAVKLLEYPAEHKLSASEYKSLEAVGSLSESVFIPSPKPSVVRLLVKDNASGRLGSLRVRLEGSKPIPTVAVSGTGNAGSPVP